MKVIRSSIIPFKGFVAINLFGVVFVQKYYEFRSIADYQRMLVHEGIHTYRNISFEREAYANQHNWYYIKERKRYAFLRYINRQ